MLYDNNSMHACTHTTCKHTPLSLVTDNTLKNIYKKCWNESWEYPNIMISFHNST